MSRPTIRSVFLALACAALCGGFLAALILMTTRRILPKAYGSAPPAVVATHVPVAASPPLNVA